MNKKNNNGNEHEESLSISKKKVLYSIYDEPEVRSWRETLRLFTYFKLRERSKVKMGEVVDKITLDYKSNRRYDFINLALAICTLQSDLLVDYNDEINPNYLDLLKEVLIYLARAEYILKSGRITEAEREKELLSKVSVSLSSFTDRVGNNFIIKKDLPDALFYCLHIYFEKIK